MAGRGVSRYRKGKAKVGTSKGGDTPNKHSASALDNSNGSRFESLQMTCRMCDEVCEENRKVFQSIQCNKCMLWAHADCLLFDKKILEELSAKGMYLCDKCKNQQSGISEDSHRSMDTENSSVDKSSTVTSVSMNSEDQYRLEFDSMKVEMPNLPDGNVYEQVDQGKFYPDLAKKSITDINKSQAHQLAKPHQR